MPRLSKMPTIPDDDAAQNAVTASWSLDMFDPDTEIDDRPLASTGYKNGGVGERHALPGALRTNRELFLAELIRAPAVLTEHATLGEAVELFACGIEGPLVLVTERNVPLGILRAGQVLGWLKQRCEDGFEQARVLEVTTQRCELLPEGATLLEAAERFVAADSDVLVVVGRDGELAGVLFARDLCLLWV